MNKTSAKLLKPRQAADSTKRRSPHKAFRAYLDKWMSDESGEQKQSWTILKQSLAENRSGNRKLFRD